MQSNTLNLEKLKGTLPKDILSILDEHFLKYEINTPLRAAHFLGQIAHESGNFTIKTESLYYTTPKRIVDIWPSRFNLSGADGKKNATEYAKNQEKLAEAVYGGRMGNTLPGDGFIYRGGGFLQLTGKDTYKRYSTYLKKPVEETANLLRSDNSYALDSALWEYCVEMKLNPVADQGMTDVIIRKISKRINGGFIGINERIMNVKKYFTLLS